jgi:hypothetical protein
MKKNTFFITLFMVLIITITVFGEGRQEKAAAGPKVLRLANQD